jgi:2-polyprenyl-3-methyl-5-hydroxy-6-metoxy-1,4-benzoquinol methylase
MGRERDRAGHGGEDTSGRDYAERLVRLESAWWKRAINAQLPYRWNIRRLRPGHTLDIGCGIGRYLDHIGASAIGVDHNADSVAIARSRGLTAYTSQEFAASADAIPESYDTLLLSHVVEHMDRDSAIGILDGYLKFLKPGRARVVFITPQEAGYRSDSTHVRFVDFAGTADLAGAVGFEVERAYSFPFPRMVGRLFRYNEFVTVTRRSAS